MIPFLLTRAGRLNPLCPEKAVPRLEETDGAIDLDSGWLEHGEVAMSKGGGQDVCLDRI